MENIQVVGMHLAKNNLNNTFLLNFRNITQIKEFLKIIRPRLKVRRQGPFGQLYANWYVV
jgi:hypothetical protein